MNKTNITRKSSTVALAAWSLRADEPMTDSSYPEARARVEAALKAKGQTLKDDEIVIPFVISTADRATDGHRVPVNAWHLDRYRMNPVVLLQHDRGGFPVGRAPIVEVRNGALCADVVFPSMSQYPRGNEVGRLVRDGYLNAVSVGFSIDDSIDDPEIPRSELGKYWTTPQLVKKATLFEFSVVTVPADAKAVKAARSAYSVDDEDTQTDNTEAQRADDVTDFPTKGDNKAVSFANSGYPVFDPAFAEEIRTKYPTIWDEGGNIKGNDQYEALKPIVERDSREANTDAEKDAMRLREAWAARHYGDHLLAGVVAQVKWYVIGELGEGGMKDLIRAEMKKIDEKSDADRKQTMQDKISAKIKKLIDEGYDPKQAAAIAYDMLGKKGKKRMNAEQIAQLQESLDGMASAIEVAQENHGKVKAILDAVIADMGSESSQEGEPVVEPPSTEGEPVMSEADRKFFAEMTERNRSLAAQK